MGIGITGDRDAMKAQLVGLLASEPDLFAQVERLFWRKDAPHEAGSVFDYFFSIVDSAAFATERPILAIRLRDTDEIRTALGALRKI